MSAVLDNIDKIIKILLGLLTFFGALKGLRLDTKGNNLNDTKKNLKNINSNNTTYNNYGNHNEMNIKIETVNQKINKNNQAKESTLDILRYGIIILFVTTIILNIIHYFNIHKSDFAKITSIGNINANLNIIVKTLLFSFRNATLVLIILNVLIALLILVLSMRHIRSKLERIFASIITIITNVFLFFNLFHLENVHIFTETQLQKNNFELMTIIIFLLIGFCSVGLSIQILNSYLFNYLDYYKEFNTKLKRIFALLCPLVLLLIFKWLIDYEGIQQILKFITKL
ncbi:hypothetical protein K4S71_09810 [Staphylococcus epidermidis]|nr:hypothetical protein [Staphylococcus epidermidis]MCG1591658.1 hypothetical protein [Staphylococcus epidermidis]MCG2478649.1 hypothetical protein [Staphylococcus epidermidis]